MGRIAMENVWWTVCWREKEGPMRKEFGYSLKGNDSSSMIPRSAKDLPHLIMAFPTGWDNLLDNRHAKNRN